jgi:hypothetical protein
MEKCYPLIIMRLKSRMQARDLEHGPWLLLVSNQTRRYCLSVPSPLPLHARSLVLSKMHKVARG